MQLGATFWHVRHESRVTSPPIWVQNLAFPPLWAAAKVAASAPTTSTGTAASGLAIPPSQPSPVRLMHRPDEVPIMADRPLHVVFGEFGVGERRVTGDRAPVCLYGRVEGSAGQVSPTEIHPDPAQRVSAMDLGVVLESKLRVIRQDHETPSDVHHCGGQYGDEDIQGLDSAHALNCHVVPVGGQVKQLVRHCGGQRLHRTGRHDGSVVLMGGIFRRAAGRGGQCCWRQIVVLVTAADKYGNLRGSQGRGIAAEVPAVPLVADRDAQQDGRRPASRCPHFGGVELPPGQGVERIGIARHRALSRDCFQGVAGLAEDHDGLPSVAGIRLADRGLEQAGQVAAALGNPAVKPTHDRDGGLGEGGLPFEVGLGEPCHLVESVRLDPAGERRQGVKCLPRWLAGNKRGGRGRGSHVEQPAHDQIRL